MSRLKVWNADTSEWEYVNAPGGSQAVLVSNPVTLTASDLHSISTVPVQIVPAPGPGFAILCISAAAQYVPGMTGFTYNGGGLMFKPAGGALGTSKAGYDALTYVGSVDITGTDPFLDYDSLVWRGGPPVLSGLEDKAIVVTSDVDFTDGDGSVIVTLYYSILAVS